MQFLYLKQMVMVGFSERTDFLKEVNKNSSVIPDLLNILEKHSCNTNGEIKNKFIIYSKFDSSKPKKFTISVGPKSLNSQYINDFSIIRIHEGNYMKFPVHNNSREKINDKWMEILMFFANKYVTHQRAFKSDFEQHSSDGSVDIYVSIK